MTMRNVGAITFFPNLGVMRMHITIIIAMAIGEYSGVRMLNFLFCETISDSIMHLIEHRGATKTKRN